MQQLASLIFMASVYHRLRDGDRDRKSSSTERLDHFTGRNRTAFDDLLCEEEEKVMSKEEIKLLDTVALVDDLPERKLKRGEVGTVVEILAPDVFEVEFSDDEGQTYAELALRADQVIALHNQGEALKIVA
jgi:hypothetical protein